MKRFRVTIEYDQEDSEVPIAEEELHWIDGGIDIPTLNDGNGCNLTIKVELV